MAIIFLGYNYSSSPALKRSKTLSLRLVESLLVTYSLTLGAEDVSWCITLNRSWYISERSTFDICKMSSVFLGIPYCHKQDNATYHYEVFDGIVHQPDSGLTPWIQVHHCASSTPPPPSTPTPATPVTPSPSALPTPTTPLISPLLPLLVLCPHISLCTSHFNSFSKISYSVFSVAYDQLFPSCLALQAPSKLFELQF